MGLLILILLLVYCCPDYEPLRGGPHEVKWVTGNKGQDRLVGRIQYAYFVRVDDAELGYDECLLPFQGREFDFVADELIFIDGVVFGVRVLIGSRPGHLEGFSVSPLAFFDSFLGPPAFGDVAGDVHAASEVAACVE